MKNFVTLEPFSCDNLERSMASFLKTNITSLIVNLFKFKYAHLDAQVAVEPGRTAFILHFIKQLIRI